MTIFLHAFMHRALLAWMAVPQGTLPKASVSFLWQDVIAAAAAECQLIFVVQLL